MYTGKQIFDLAMDLIGKRANTGQIDANKTKSYSVLAPGLLTLWQSEISENASFFNKVEISNNPIENMLGKDKGFDYQVFKGEDLIFSAVGSVKAYYFEVDGEGTVYIEDYNGTWNTLETITIGPEVTTYTAYKGVVTPTSGATQSRMRFSGTYRYSITNYAMFDLPLSPTRIPNYQPWVKYTMPSNFNSVDKVVSEFKGQNYVVDSKYWLEENKEFFYSYNFEGKMRVIYKPIPVQITSLDQTLEVDDKTSMTGAYFLAAHLMLIEDPESAGFLNGKYEENSAKTFKKQPANPQPIIDVYSGGD